MNGDTLQQKATHKVRKNSQLHYLQRQEGGLKCFKNLSELVHRTTGHHGRKAKGCQRHRVYVCGVAQHAEESPGWGR